VVVKNYRDKEMGLFSKNKKHFWLVSSSINHKEFASLTVETEQKFFGEKGIEFARHSTAQHHGFDVANVTPLSVSYLGHMTVEQFNASE
jgi:hypothetical protein